MGLRAEKKEETRQAILEASLVLFRGKGFEDTRVQDVTGQLRISQATFFNYFPTKQAVLEAAAQELLDSTLQLLRTDVALVDAPVPERLEELVRAFARHFAGDRELVELLASHTRFFLGTHTGGHGDTHLLLTELFRQGQARGEVRADVPAAQLADLYVGATLATVDGWLVAPHDGGGPLDERLLASHRVLWAGAAAPLSRARPRGRPAPAAPGTRPTR
jgi:AcrR family transcriptional regulator